MNKYILHTLIIAVFILLLGVSLRDSKTDCSTYNVPPWGDPSKGTYFNAQGQQVTAAEFERGIAQELLKDTYDPALAAHYGLAAPSTPASAAAPSSGKTAAPKEKIDVYFTDMLGNVIGTSKVTKGTDIAASQFPQTVEDIELGGKVYSFDSWDYDGRLIEHQYIHDTRMICM